MNITITGGSGFLGRQLITQLLQQDVQVRSLVRQTSQHDDRVECRQVDFNKVDSLKEALHDCDLLLHTIGITNGSEQVLHEVNVNITQNVVDALSKRTKKIVYVSSAAAAMRKGPYGEAKLQAESIIQHSEKDWVILRPTLIYGPGDTKNLQMMIDWVTQKMFVPVLGGGHFKVQPVYIEDACHAIVQACLRQVEGNIFNVCGPEQVSLRSMLDQLKQKTKSHCVFVSVPLKPVQKALKVWSMIWPKTKLPVKQILELDKHEAFDLSQTQKMLDFNPRRFSEGLHWL